MIADHDRSGYIGASDTDKVIGNWKTKTWEKWWENKIGIDKSTFSNRYTMAGTHWEHRILESLGIPMVFDRQVIKGRLRVNLDADDGQCIYECKTAGAKQPFTMPQKYINQVQVQMYCTGIHKAKIVVYLLEDADYDNYYRAVDPERLTVYDVPYDETWVQTVYLPKLRVLEKCLDNGRWPVWNS